MTAFSSIECDIIRIPQIAEYQIIVEPRHIKGAVVDAENRVYI
jgi:hypothetical protein